MAYRTAYVRRSASARREVTTLYTREAGSAIGGHYPQNVRDILADLRCRYGKVRSFEIEGVGLSPELSVWHVDVRVERSSSVRDETVVGLDRPSSVSSSAKGTFH